MSTKVIMECGCEEKSTGKEAYHIVSQEKGGSDVLSNCEMLSQRCHKATRNFAG